MDGAEARMPAELDQDKPLDSKMLTNYRETDFGTRGTEATDHPLPRTARSAAGGLPLFPDRASLFHLADVFHDIGRLAGGLVQGLARGLVRS